LRSRGQFELGTEQFEHLAAFERHAVRHRQYQPITLGGADKGERDPGIAGGRLDQHGAGLDPAGGLGGSDHRAADAVLDRSERVEELALAQNVCLGPGILCQTVDADERGGTDGLDNAVIDAAAKLSAGAGVVALSVPTQSLPLRSDLDITALGRSAGDPGTVCAAAQLLEGQRIEPPHHLLLELEPHRPHDLMPKCAAGRVADRILGGFEPADRTDNIAEADPPPLACKAIATARAADSEQDLVPYQLLQHWFEITARDPFALGYLGRSHWHLAAVVRDVEHRLDCEKQFLG
jgi:hypothetical protein